MQAVTKQIHYWSKRFLTVLGRIVVVKSLLLTKLHRLILSLPTPSKDMVNRVGRKTLLFSDKVGTLIEIFLGIDFYYPKVSVRLFYLGSGFSLNAIFFLCKPIEAIVYYYQLPWTWKGFYFFFYFFLFQLVKVYLCFYLLFLNRRLCFYVFAVCVHIFTEMTISLTVIYGTLVVGTKNTPHSILVNEFRVSDTFINHT